MIFRKSAPVSVTINMFVLIFLTLNSTMQQTKFNLATPLAHFTLTFPAETREIKELVLKTKIKVTCKHTGLSLIGSTQLKIRSLFRDSNSWTLLLLVQTFKENLHDNNACNIIYRTLLLDFSKFKIKPRIFDINRINFLTTLCLAICLAQPIDDRFDVYGQPGNHSFFIKANLRSRAAGYTAWSNPGVFGNRRR